MNRCYKIFVNTFILQLIFLIRSFATVLPIAPCPADTVAVASKFPASYWVTVKANNNPVTVYQASNPKTAMNRYAWLKADENINIELNFTQPVTSLDLLRKPRSSHIKPLMSNNGKTWTFLLEPGDYVALNNNNQYRFFIFVEKIPTLKVNPNDPTVINVLSKNADNTGATITTEAIQSAIDEASKGTKKIVYVPSGIYECGTLFMKSNVHLYLEEGAFIRGARKPGVWKWEQDPLRGNEREYTSSSLIFFKTIGTDTIRNAKISGFGIIDGSGDYWRRPSTAGDECNEPSCWSRDSTHSSKGVSFHNAVDCNLDGPIIRNTVYWHTYVLGGKANKILNTKLLGVYRINNSGVELDNTKNCKVHNTMILSTESGVGFRNSHAFNFNDPNSNDTISDCIIITVHYNNIKIGGSLHLNYNCILDNIQANEFVKWEATKKTWTGDPSIRISGFKLSNVWIRQGFSINPTANNDFYCTNLSISNCKFGDTVSLRNIDTLAFVNSSCKNVWLRQDADLLKAPVNSKGISYLLNTDTTNATFISNPKKLLPKFTEYNNPPSFYSLSGKKLNHKIDRSLSIILVRNQYGFPKPTLHMPSMKRE